MTRKQIFVCHKVFPSLISLGSLKSVSFVATANPAADSLRAIKLLWKSPDSAFIFATVAPHSIYNRQAVEFAFGIHCSKVV